MESMIKRILAVGSIVNETQHRIRALRALGYQVDTIDSTAKGHAPGLNYFPGLVDRVRNKLGYPADKQHVNQKLINYIKSNEYDLLWVEKCLCLQPKTLKQVKKTAPRLILAWFSPDDMFARHNQSAYFRQSLSLYDYVFTTKSYNCDANELPALGARRVYFTDKGFDRYQHRPVPVSKEEVTRLGADVGFIGTFENERAMAMLYLAEHGVQVRIWGNGWQQFAKKHPHPNLQIELKPIYGDDYQKAICATKINLCFLRKINRDLQTLRSVEIPACGAFMLAERTQEHRRLFEENKEAVFFDSNDFTELLTKVEYYLEREDERKAIAQAGYEKCYQADYANENRLQQMLSIIENDNR